MGEGGELFGVHKLFHIAQVHLCLVDGEAVCSVRAHFYSVFPCESVISPYDPAKIGSRGSGEISGRIRIVFRFLFGKRGDLDRAVLFHLDDTVGFMEVRAAASCHQYCGDTVGIVKFPDPVDKRNDRFRIPADNALHQIVPDHKVRSTGILIDQEKFCARFHSFDGISCLRGAAAGIFRVKSGRIPAVRKVADKHGDIRLLNTSAVFRPEFHRRIVCDHIFPAVSVDMVINACHQCL